MISAKHLGLAFTIASAVLFGCAPQGDEGVDAAEGATRTSPCAANVDISFVEIHESVPATTPDELNPEFNTCDTDLQILQIAGTAHDAEVNKILGSDLIGKTNPCEAPETISGSVVLKYLANGVLSTAGPDSWYGGGAHGSYAIEYKNIDLQTGKEISLADLVTDEARATIVKSLKAQISVQKYPSYDANGQPKMTAAGKPVMERIDDDSKRALLGIVDFAFGRDEALADFKSFAVGTKGLSIDLTNHLPHAMRALEATYFVKYSTLQGKLQTRGPITRLVK